ncbi:uncharacterized protein LOC130625110 [Hydractinia symbiolongicarpus]|uniref:uncharacterized protein LOC130625110 n=1 Tax=Hydractinia symbiolongicarpus TaxID=13093 RepID=UPI00255034CB|nr:uncharacterized protein LOC130625110 [Hydractinia symbiolongicarpus]
MTQRRRSPVNKMADTSENSETASVEGYEMKPEEMKLLDQQEELEKGNIYANNRLIFLLQSTLLGLSYSMIWPTLWTYIRDEFDMNNIFTKFIYSVTYVAYPIASMISAYLVRDAKMSTKKTILILNSFEIIGNLVYTLMYFPGLPVLGRFIAGLGDAFYVVLMKEMNRRQTANDRMTMECLAAFIFGVIVAPGLNIITTYLHFTLGTWRLNSNNYPGLTISVLFLFIQFIIIFFLSDESSSGKTSKDEKSEEARFPFDPISTIKDSNYQAAMVTFYSFTYTYIVTSFEIMIPMIIYELIQTNEIGAMLLYAVIGTLYAMFLVMTMTVSFNHQLEVFVGISSVAQVGGLFSLIYFNEFMKPSVGSIVSLIVVVLALTTMWSIDDVLFINFVQVVISPNKREVTHDLRKAVSKCAFALAGVTVPFWFSKVVFVVGPVLIILVSLLLVVFIIVRVSTARQR